MHVASIFAGSLGFSGLGLLLILAWSVAGRGRRRPEDAEPSPATRPLVRPTAVPAPPVVEQPAEQPVEQPVEQPAEVRDDRDDSPDQDPPDDRDEPPSRPPAGTRPLRSGAAALAATLAVGWWARRRRRGTTALLLGALLLGGCGFTDERDPVDLKPGLEQGASEEMLADYARRLTRAVRWSTGPKDDDSRWDRAQAGPALAASRWRVATDAQPPRRRAARPRLRAAGVHYADVPPLPDVGRGRGRGGRRPVAGGLHPGRVRRPWLAAVSIGLDDVTVPAPAPEPGATDSVVTQAAETVSELVAQWWEEGAVSGLVVDEQTRALRAGSLPTGGRPTVEAWPDPAQRYFPVEADGSTRLVVTVHRVEDAAGAHASEHGGAAACGRPAHGAGQLALADRLGSAGDSSAHAPAAEQRPLVLEQQRGLEAYVDRLARGDPRVVAGEQPRHRWSGRARRPTPAASRSRSRLGPPSLSSLRQPAARPAGRAARPGRRRRRRARARARRRAARAPRRVPGEPAVVASRTGRARRRGALGHLAASG